MHLYIMGYFPVSHTDVQPSASSEGMVAKAPWPHRSCAQQLLPTDEWLGRESASDEAASNSG